MVVIRWILGRLILSLDFLFSPRGVKRDSTAQAQLDKQTSSLALYQYKACPFCVKVRRAMKRNALKIETRDAKRNEQYSEELRQGGGRLKVPCLKIQEDDGQEHWVYESSEIIRYLEGRFGQTA